MTLPIAWKRSFTLAILLLSTPPPCSIPAAENGRPEDTRPPARRAGSSLFPHDGLPAFPGGERLSSSSPVAPGASTAGDDPFAGQSELSLDRLVTEVERRNPSLQAMIAAWSAAAERYPQVVSLDDPMFEFMVATAHAGTNDGMGYSYQLSQAIPWPGKRQLRGAAAAAEADAARGEIVATRLQLAEAARTAFYQYYLACRQLEVNQRVSGLMREFRDIAQSKYEVSQAMQQDVLQAEVELAELAGRRAELVRDQRVATARINTLLHRAVDYPLPPPPAKIQILDTLPSAEALERQAIQSRPDLLSISSEIRAQEANLALACKEYYPDMNFVARYDGSMGDPAMRPMVGMGVNVPLWLVKRDAAVREARDRLQQRHAEYQNRLDEVRFEVQSALERLVQGRQIVQLYTQRILPAAEESLKAARANYTVGKIDFLRLLDAERQYNNQEDRYHQAVADYQTRWAELERAVGGF